LSRGKTLVSDKFFSLNSSFFWSRPEKAPRPVPVTRVSCFSKQFEDWGSLSGSFRSFTRGYHGAARVAASVFFLKKFRAKILQAGRSVVRGLGIPAHPNELALAGLWRRELWYFDSVPESEDCLPPSPSRLRWGSVPPGWKRVPVGSVALLGEVKFVKEGEPLPPPPVSSSATDDLQRCFWSELVARTWVESPSRGALLAEYRSEVVRTGKERLWRSWRRRPRLAMCLQFHLRKRLSREAFDNWTSKPKCALVWAPVVERSFESESTDQPAVSDLVEWERLSFEPPSFWPDPRYGVGYR
jgi:hypothetical protein